MGIFYARLLLHCLLWCYNIIPIHSRQNFLHVDIFYRELNTESISQRGTFTVSSLLGEVGGFLGLLLGASVLTMCELIDHLIMSCLAKMRAKKQVGIR